MNDVVAARRELRQDAVPLRELRNSRIWGWNAVRGDSTRWFGLSRAPRRSSGQPQTCLFEFIIVGERRGLLRGVTVASMAMFKRDGREAAI